MAPNDVNTIEYYGLDAINTDKVQHSIRNAVNALMELKLEQNASPTQFVMMVFDTKPLVELLIYLSRLPVFDKDFSACLSHDLDLLATVKKLKYYNNLPLAQNLQLIQQLMMTYGIENKEYGKTLLE